LKTKPRSERDSVIGTPGTLRVPAFFGVLPCLDDVGLTVRRVRHLLGELNEGK
jgi:hypothetical protein